MAWHLIYTWTNVDQDAWQHKAPLGHHELITRASVVRWRAEIICITVCGLIRGHYWSCELWEKNLSWSVKDIQVLYLFIFVVTDPMEIVNWTHKTNFSEILLNIQTSIQTFSLKKMHLKMSVQDSMYQLKMTEPRKENRQQKRRKNSPSNIKGSETLPHLFQEFISKWWTTISPVSYHWT